MAKVSDVARSAIAAVESSVGLSLCAQWVIARYSQFVRRARLRHLRTVRQMYLPAPITTGTFSITQGSKVTTPDSDAITAINGTSIAGWYIRFGTHNTWYVVESYDGTVLRTTSEVTEDTDTDASFQLYQRFHELPTDVRWVGSFVHVRFHRELISRTSEELNMKFPGRELIGPPPMYMAEGPRAVSGAKTVEFYPYSTEPETMHYVAWAVPPELDLNSDIPSDVDLEMLKEGTLIDIYRWEAMRALLAGKVEAAGGLGNEARRQYTQWFGKDLPEATAAERAMDDTQIILETAGGRSDRGSFTDIRDARDQIWSRGS